QFSVLAGTGISFHDKWEIGYRFLHISNADIHDNNDGRDEHLAVITFVF
ncbi:MAG: acyloxyacyl hydrolase, partial [Thermodesulfatator sp.]